MIVKLTICKRQTEYKEDTYPIIALTTLLGENIYKLTFLPIQIRQVNTFKPSQSHRQATKNKLNPPHDGT